MKKKQIIIIFSLLLSSISTLSLQATSTPYTFPEIGPTEVVQSDVLNDGKWNYIEILNIDPERYERHKREALPILSGEISAFKAFQNGLETMIANYLKLENENNLIRRIVEGEIIVNEETKTMAQLIKDLLENYHSVEFVKQDKEYFVISGGQLYDLKKLLEFANFNQISFADSALNNYHEYIHAGILKAKPLLPNAPFPPTNEDFIKADPEGICQKLHLAEKESINIYTGSGYFYMNAFLRGDLDAIAWGDDVEEINSRFKESLLHSAVAVSGLNKMPDYVPPSLPDGSLPQYLYRGEYSTPEPVLQKRKDAVDEGGDTTLESGFISTSYGQPSGFFGEHSSCGIMFKNLKGKKITPLSMFGNGEREVLFPPTHVQWRYHKVIVSDEYKREISIFLAKPVTAPLGTISEPGPLSEEPQINVLITTESE